MFSSIWQALQVAMTATWATILQALHSLVVATWAAAFGAILAAAVALYLARAAQRIQLRASCCVRSVIVNQDASGAPKEIFLSVENVGQRTAVVSQIKMCAGRFPRKCCKTIRLTMKEEQSIHDSRFYPPDKPLFEIDESAHISTEIPGGGRCDWFRPLGYSVRTQHSELEPVKNFVKTKRNAKTLRLVIYTTHGYKRPVKPQSLIDCLIEIFDANT